MVRFSYTYGLPNVSICGVPFHYNLVHYIALKISKRQQLQCWAGRNLTHMADWEAIGLVSFNKNGIRLQSTCDTSSQNV